MAGEQLYKFQTLLHPAAPKLTCIYHVYRGSLFAFPSFSLVVTEMLSHFTGFNMFCSLDFLKQK